MPDFKVADLDAWYVNLSDRPDRRERMEQELARVRLKAQRLEAYRPGDWLGPPEKVARMQARTPGAIGCHMSQCAVIAKAVASGRNVLVLEDDVVFADDLRDRLAYLERAMAGKAWDILWLGATFHVPGEWHVGAHAAEMRGYCHCALGRDVECTDDPRILRTYGIWSTYAWIVNADSAAGLLRRFDERLQDSIGIDFLTMCLQPELQCFAFVPGSAWQIDNESDIGRRLPSGQRSVTEFSHFRNLGPYAWQPRMTDFDPASFDWKDARR